MVCKNCGAENIEIDKYCESCGERIIPNKIDSAINEVLESKRVQEGTSKLWKITKIILISGIILILVGNVIAFLK